MDRQQLRGIVYSRYRSESEMAKQMGWPKQRLNKITTGAKEPTVQELNELAIALDMEIGRLAQIFLQ